MKSLLAIILGGIMALLIYGVSWLIEDHVSFRVGRALPALFLALFSVRVVKSWMYDEEEHGVVLWLLLQRACCEMSGHGLREVFECHTGRILSGTRFYAIMATLEKDGKVCHRDEDDEHGTNTFYRAI